MSTLNRAISDPVASVIRSPISPQAPAKNTKLRASAFNPHYL
jgi:hypothetical protein